MPVIALTCSCIHEGLAPTPQNGRMAFILTDRSNWYGSLVHRYI